jgi:hypothetical protein
MTLKITDDSGFIAIVNSDKYISFVDKDWELPQLLHHFVTEMNKDTLIIWSTGMENNWTVDILDKPSNKKSYRELNKSISVTEGQLFLTNYEDLTMAAQFDNERIPSKHNSELNIKLDNGKYNFTIRQMYDPYDNNYDPTQKTNFEIIISAVNNSSTQVAENVFWWPT